MILARVVGTVVATRKDPRLEGKTLLILKPVSPEGKDEAGYVVAVDTVSAGFRERVIAVSGSSARMAAGLQGHARRHRHRRHRGRRAAGREVAMFLGRVVGRVWSTVKHPGLEGQRLLIVQPITPEAETYGPAAWSAATGPAPAAGETVYWCRGKESSFTFLPSEVPTDLCIVGIVDSIHTKKEPAC